jgi:hypothetical protein
VNILYIGLLTFLSAMSTGFYAKETQVYQDHHGIVSAVQLVEDDWQMEVSEIDKEINKLSNQRNLYLAKATRLQNQGDRLQFENDDNLIDARRAWQQAQIHREIATRIQEQIDVLEARKKQILEAHGVANPRKK